MQILVPQVVDQANDNSGVLNAKALLSRFSNPDIEWTAIHYHVPDSQVASSKRVRLVRLWRRHLWMLHKVVFYQNRADAIFYPGAYWFDEIGMRLRAFFGRRVPVIATYEGLLGGAARDSLHSNWAGHTVFCQRVPADLLAKADRLFERADHIFAISPFLAQQGRRLYGEKFSVVSLGIDSRIFFPPTRVGTGRRFSVVGAGRLYENKQPRLFVEMGARFPEADFTWWGEGELREGLIVEAREKNLANVRFPGPIPNAHLPEQLRAASLFVLPSLAEGAPKVIQEAAACGLPVIVFGYYEAPTVVNGENGFVVWNDNELFERVGELIANPGKARDMGQVGARMAKEWAWDRIAPLWEARILEILGNRASGRLQFRGNGLP